MKRCLQLGKKFGQLTIMSACESSSSLLLCRCKCGSMVKATMYDLERRNRKSCRECYKKSNKILTVGQTFGDLTVVGHDQIKNRYVLKCSCGKEILSSTYNIKRKKFKSCISCTKKSLGTLEVGQKFGKLIIVRYDKEKECWVCRCDCGSVVGAQASKLKNGKHKQCRACCTSELLKNPKMPNYEAVKRMIYRSYKHSAKINSRSFELNFDEVSEIIQKPCAYCGKLPVIADFKRYQNDRIKRINFYNGIDRQDNSIGYTKENSVPCCRICNVSKRNMTLEDWMDWVKRIYRHSIENKKSPEN